MSTKYLPFKILIILAFHIISYFIIFGFALLQQFANCSFLIHLEIHSILQNLLFIVVCGICLDWEKKYAKLTWVLCQIIYIPLVIWMYPYDSLWQFSQQLDWGIDPYAFIGEYELVYLLFIATPLNILGIIIYYTVKKYYPRLLRKQ